MKTGDIVKANDSLFTNKENMRIGVVTEIFGHRCFVAFDNAINKGPYRKGSPYYGWWYDMTDVVQTGRNIRK